ncbi:MAG: polysaccharide deacetylase family protein [Paracoccaceae bacterium]
MMRLVARTMQLISGPPLSILMYHAVVDKPLLISDWCFIPTDQFNQQMSWLAENRLDVMPLHEAVNAMQEGRLTGPTVAVTFDDGYRNNVDVSLPVLERYGIPASIFLTTGLINSGHTLWSSRLNLAIAGTERTELSWRGTTYAIADDQAHTRVLRRLKEQVKQDAGADPELAVAEIERLLDVPENPTVPRDSPYAMMDKSDIERAISSGLINFGAHTISHPVVSTLVEPELATEINGSLRAVKDLVGLRPLSFAYPNGQRADYDDRAMQHLKAQKIEIALTTMPGANRQGADCLQLCRFGVGLNKKPYRFAMDAYGLPFSALAQSIRAFT